MLKLFMASLLATQAATVPPPPAPPGPPCLTRAQFGDLGVVGAAMFVGVAQNVCRPHLRPGAFLTSEAGTLYVAGVRAEGRNRLPSIVQGVIPMLPGPAGSPTMMRGMLSALLADDAGGEWTPMANPALCRDTDELIEAASVMTPERTARFLGAFASLADQIYRMMPPPSRPAPPAAAPGARSTPLAFTPGAPPPPPGARPGPPRPPMPPFLCRQGE